MFLLGKTTPKPDVRGGVGVDDRLMREPRLLVPRTGVMYSNTKVDFRHEFFSDVLGTDALWVLDRSAFSPKGLLGNEPFCSYNCPSYKFSPVGWGPYNNGINSASLSVSGGTQNFVMWCLVWIGNVPLDRGNSRTGGVVGDGDGVLFGNTNTGNWWAAVRGASCDTGIAMVPGVYGVAMVSANSAETIMFVNGIKIPTPITPNYHNYGFYLFRTTRDSTSGTRNQVIGAIFGYRHKGNIQNKLQLVQRMSLDPLACLVPA